MKHLDAASHTRGQSQYVDDVPPPADLLHAAVFTSPVAHGKIVQLNTKKALDSEGVVAVLTARDIPGENQVGPLMQDEPLLAEETGHFVGQPVAVVVAEAPAAGHRAGGTRHARQPHAQGLQPHRPFRGDWAMVARAATQQAEHRLARRPALCNSR